MLGHHWGFGSVKHLKHFLIFAFILSALADIVTTMLFSGAGLEMRESNLFFMIGVPLWVLYIVKMVLVLMIAFLMVRNRFSSERLYYFMMVLMIILTFAQTVVSIGNYEVYEQSEYYMELPEPTVQELHEYRRKANNILILNPLIFAIIPYLLFEWTMPYQRFDKRRLERK